jgi:hypothetical protein
MAGIDFRDQKNENIGKDSDRISAYKNKWSEPSEISSSQGGEYKGFVFWEVMSGNLVE